MRIDRDKKVVVLTGAGISAESGLKTFRDNNGLWENHSVERVATPEGFIANPALVWKFYKQRYNQLDEVQPNPAHYALKKMEDHLGNNFHLITQNIDGLHFTAGNKNVIEMHGSLQICFCSSCKKKYNMAEIDLQFPVPICDNCGGQLRPDIVWFGEVPYHMERIYGLLQDADYFVVVGTSGVVYPAAGFLMIAMQCGAYTIGVNFEEPRNASMIDEFYKGKAGEVLPTLVDEWIGNNI